MMTPELIDRLFDAAKASVPMEMCGLVFGQTFVPATNVADDPLHNFEIAPEEYLKACMVHDSKPWALVHSHPTSPAYLSVKDCQLMDALEKTNHDLVMVIVSVSAWEIHAFVKRGHVYQRLWEIT